MIWIPVCEVHEEEVKKALTIVGVEETCRRECGFDKNCGPGGKI
jgi:hypothetical protein